jgi:transposase-like protein
MTCRRCGRGPLVLRNTGADRRYWHVGRSLCSCCYRTVHRHGRLADYPRRAHRRQDLLDDYELLRSAGAGVGEIAARLGIQRDSLTTALRRARQEGLTHA